MKKGDKLVGCYVMSSEDGLRFHSLGRSYRVHIDAPVPANLRGCYELTMKDVKEGLVGCPARRMEPSVLTSGQQEAADEIANYVMVALGRSLTESKDTREAAALELEALIGTGYYEGEGDEFLRAAVTFFRQKRLGET